MTPEEQIKCARDFAIDAHGRQRYGVKDRFRATFKPDQFHMEPGLPYVFHLDMVADVLRDFGEPPSSILHVAAYLHDVLEDVPRMTREALQNQFGEEIATLVWHVTNEPGANRAERHAKTYPKIASSLNAIRLKLADRIANVQYSLDNESPHLGMYIDEYPAFRAALHPRGGPTAMWMHLASLINRSRGD